MSNPRKPQPRTEPRPSGGGTLISSMAVCLLVSLLIWGAHGQGDGPEWMIFIGICTGAAVACFLILFAAYWLGWALRAHALWLARQHPDEGP